MLAIIQARMTSRRLRGKVLKKINHKFVLKRVVENISKSKYISKIIVATSINISDDKIYKFCKDNRIECFRGDLKNVSMRFKQLLDKTGSKSFVRICADSPFIDFRIINNCIKSFKTNKYDIVTNVLERTFPKGQSVEIFKSEIFKENIKNIKNKNFQEHVTTYFYKNKKKFKIKNILSKKNLSFLNFCVDNKSDIEFLRSVSKKIERSYNSNYRLKNLIDCVQDLN